MIAQHQRKQSTPETSHKATGSKRTSLEVEEEKVDFGQYFLIGCNTEKEEFANENVEVNMKIGVRRAASELAKDEAEAINKENACPIA
ncbi:hypothetical protein NDU88_005668 [Pleurodeles waltl]|uniref:Uncharacterized protein n=1 Tax=Pleurodeles waltl TaxID=8319 RepID=A0AAV7TD96_PLEWA|nr:hypothetical protein NDU88_005668 [Pleurodeles waltl]